MAKAMTYRAVLFHENLDWHIALETKNLNL